MLNPRFSLQIGKVKDIPIVVHWSFSLFIGFILYISWQNRFSVPETLWLLSFVLLLFGFVILHELGHATAAKRYGISTRDIIISPIGGIARLEGLPGKPIKELIVAIAGPVVNLGLAILFFLIIIPFSRDFVPTTDRIDLIASPLDYLRYLLLINISLVVFNMIPAFPMDGGRVLRALLATRYSKVKATYYAIMVAKGFALIFLIVGVYYSHIVLALIGGFVLFMSGSEYTNTLFEHVMKNYNVCDALPSSRQVVSGNVPVRDLIKSYNDQHKSWLVTDDAGNIVGSMPSSFIQYARKNKLTDLPVAELMSDNFGQVHEDLNLLSLFSLMNRNGWSVVNVVNNDFQSVGSLDRGQLQQFIQETGKKIRRGMLD